MVQYGKLLGEILSMTLKNGQNFDRRSKIHNVDKYERVICGCKLGCGPLHLESLNLHKKKWQKMRLDRQNVANL